MQPGCRDDGSGTRRRGRDDSLPGGGVLALLDGERAPTGTPWRRFRAPYLCAKWRRGMARLCTETPSRDWSRAKKAAAPRPRLPRFGRQTNWGNELCRPNCLGRRRLGKFVSRPPGTPPNVRKRAGCQRPGREPARTRQRGRSCAKPYGATEVVLGTRLNRACAALHKKCPIPVPFCASRGVFVQVGSARKKAADKPAAIGQGHAPALG
jgi:hypothetical protein